MRILLSPLLISLLFLPPGICVCAATSGLQPNTTQERSSSQEDGLPDSHEHQDALPDSHEHHAPDCPAIGPDQQSPRPEAKVRLIVPELGAMLPPWLMTDGNEFSVGLPAAAGLGVAVTPLHILQRILLI